MSAGRGTSEKGAGASASALLSVDAVRHLTGDHVRRAIAALEAAAAALPEDAAFAGNVGAARLRLGRARSQLAPMAVVGAGRCEICLIPEGGAVYPPSTEAPAPPAVVPAAVAYSPAAGKMLCQLCTPGVRP